MAKWWDNIKERLGIGKSEQDREFEKQLKEAEDRSLKEQEREAKNVFFKGIRSEEKTEQRQNEAQDRELAKLEKGFARNEDKMNKAINDPAFKDFPDEPKAPKMNNDLRQRPEIPAGKPTKASKPLPQVAGEFVDTMSSSEKLPIEPRKPLVPTREPPEPPVKNKVQTPEEFSRDMDKAVEAALKEDKAKTAAKAGGPAYGAIPDEPSTFIDKNSVKPEPNVAQIKGRNRAATQYEGMPTKDTQYVELDKVPSPYGVMPSQGQKAPENYGPITQPENKTKGYETLPEVKAAVDGKRPEQRPRAQTAGEKYPTGEREQRAVFKVAEEFRGRDYARRETGKMDALKLDSVESAMKSSPASKEAFKGALKEGKEFEAALKEGGKVFSAERDAVVKDAEKDKPLPDLVARREAQKAAQSAVVDQYAGGNKAISDAATKAEMSQVAKQYGATEEISRASKRLTVANPAAKDGPYGEMSSVAAAIKDFPPKDVAALMGAAQSVGDHSKGEVSKADRSSLEVGGNAKGGAAQSHER